jgi:hypothetical protein
MQSTKLIILILLPIVLLSCRDELDFMNYKEKDMIAIDTTSNKNTGDNEEEKKDDPEETNPDGDQEDEPETPLQINNGTIYTIKRGRHQSVNQLRRHTSENMQFKVIFDESAIYKTSNPSNQASINKLFGFSDCGSHHQQNSARVGWRWFNDQLELMAYVYNNGRREFASLAVIEVGKVYEVSINSKGDHYLFSTGKNEVRIGKGCENNNSIRYKLFPYFGGKDPAPHEVRIVIEEF